MSERAAEKPELTPYGRSKIEPPKTKPIQCVNDANGHPVHDTDPEAYLCFDRATCRYYLVPSKPKVYFGANLDAAIWRYRAYVEELKEVQAKVEYTAIVPYGSPIHWNMRTGFPTKVKQTLAFPELEAYKFIADKILKDPKDAARKLGIPEIARLNSLPTPVPSAKLSEILDAYLAKRNKPSPEEIKKIRWYWGFFVEAVSPATTVQDLDANALSRWEEAA